MTIGGVLSRATVIVRGDSALPALSVAKKVTVVCPSTPIVMVVDAPAIVVAAITWAPLALTVMSLTAEPPASSAAASVITTSLLFHPAGFGGGDCDIAVTGGAWSSGVPVAPLSTSATGMVFGAPWAR